MASHTIPEDQSKYGNFDALDERLQNSVKKLLSEPSKESDSHSVVYASDLFKACSDYGMYCLKIKFVTCIIKLC
jgi:predicted metalloendopeptidase